MAKEKDVEQPTQASDTTEEAGTAPIQEVLAARLRRVVEHLGETKGMNGEHLGDHVLSVALDDIDSRLQSAIRHLQTA